MTFKKGRAWGSKMDGIRSANRHHVCLDCRHHQTEIFKNCPSCGSKNRQYFMSEAEFKRGMQLLVLLAAGTIERLRFQPRYDIAVNGRHICTYIADAEYFERGQMVVEDTKPEKFMDTSAVLKIKLFEAVYNLTVKIPQRKSGNRSKAQAPTLI